MIREAFVVGVDDTGNNPRIFKVDVTNPLGVSWREAKKQLRNFYIERARSLRKISQQDYFANV
jgi:hypothetical protein